MRRLAGLAALLLLALLTLASGAWGALALLYSDLRDEGLRTALATGFAAVALLTLLALTLRRWRWRWRAFAAYAAALLLLIAWWRGIEPSNQRNWQTDVAVLPEATVDGDIVTVRNIRNFSYRSEFDYTPAYYDRRFDIGKLEGVDLIAVYWMGPAIAHVFVSFAFSDGQHLAVSIETRKEQGEAYSTIKGFFRQYELYYVVADERDVIGLRSNYRRDPPEDVYIYRIKGPIENGRRLFLEYIRQINRLKAGPEFYNTLTTNCTTNIWANSLVNATHVPLDWKILASGYVPQYLYEQGRLETYGLPFAELQQRAHINARARAAGMVADFSQRIRATVPPAAASAAPRSQN